MIRGMKHNVALDSAAVDALSALPSRGQSQIVLLFLTSTLTLARFSKHIRGKKPRSFHLSLLTNTQRGRGLQRMQEQQQTLSLIQ